MVNDVVFCWGGGQVCEAANLDREVAKTLNCMHEAPRILTVRHEVANGSRMTKIYENHGQDSRVRDCGEVSPTIHRKTGTGGNNVPIVMSMLNCINMGGGKSSCSVTKYVSPTLDCAHGGAPVITGRKK